MYQSEKLSPVVSLVSVHHSWSRAGLVVSVLSECMGYLRHGNSVRWHKKNRLESGPVTADLTTGRTELYIADKRR